MVVVLTGYNRNSKFDLVANGSKVAQKVRIAGLLGTEVGLKWGQVHNR